MTREEIIKYLNIIKAFFLGSEHQPISDAYFALDEAIKALEQEPKTGHWINGDCKGGNCSICGEYYAFYPESGDFNYCPNCGAKMSEIPTGSDPQESEKVN